MSDATQTCRFSARLTAGGSQARAEFSDTVVGHGYTIVAASIASGSGLAVVPSTSQPLTFAGQGTVPVGSGDTVLSDPVALGTAAGDTVEVTMEVTAGGSPGMINGSEPAGCTTGVVADMATASATRFSTASQTKYLRSVLVYGTPVRSIVALGDSLTASPYVPVRSRWTDVLVGHGAAIANAGVGGSAVSIPGFYRTPVGPTLAASLLAEPGITDVVVELGENDLSMHRTGSDVLSGLAQILQTASSRHLQAWVTTLTPRGGPAG